MSRLMILLGLVSLTGCMTTPSRVTVDELNTFKVDCRYKQEQISFLESQLPTKHEQAVNRVATNSVGGSLVALNDGTYWDRQKKITGYDVAMIHSNLRYLKDYCK